MNNIKRELQLMITELRAKHQDKVDRAYWMFPHHPQAARYWAGLSSGCAKDNTMQTVVDTLGLTTEYAEYLRDVNGHFESGNNEAAAMAISSWVDYLCQQIELNYYMFKDKTRYPI